MVYEINLLFEVSSGKLIGKGKEVSDVMEDVVIFQVVHQESAITLKGEEWLKMNSVDLLRQNIFISLLSKEGHIDKHFFLI